MKLLQLLFKRDTIAPMLAMIFASTVTVALVFARIAWTGHLRYGFLAWNLFLAWLPLVFAILAREFYREDARPRGRFFAMAAAWLLFFPNAPYIFTDLIHLTYQFHSSHFWVDLTLILSAAFTGLIVGFVSLYLMQSVVTRLLGRVLGWLFVAATAALSSFGIYLGRFLRFNSWDVVLRPAKLYREIAPWADGTTVNTSSMAFLVLFATFLFIAYVMLYALTHLPQAAQFPSSENSNSAPT